ncbi:MAG: pectate lyase, partial [Candidatus Binatia bacterium]
MRGGWSAAVGVAVLAVVLGVERTSFADEPSLNMPDEPPIFAEYATALDAVLARERVDGGWVFGTQRGERVHPHTYPLRFAERVAAPFGLADWDIVVLRSPGTPAAILALLNGYRLLGDERYVASARRAGDLLVALQMSSGGWFSEMPARGRFPVPWFTWTVLRTAIDDDVTPGAIRALLALYQMTRQDAYRDAAERGIAFLLERQLPVGAWPLVARPKWKQMLYR